MIAITYTTEECEFDHWDISQNGEATPVMRLVTQKHRINFSRDLSELARAKDFVSQMSDTERNPKVHVIADTKEAWEKLLLID